MKKLFILAAAAVAFAACSNNESDNQVQNPDNAIRLNASVGEITRAGNALLASQFESDMKVTVHVTDNAATNKKTYSDVVYTYDGTNWNPATTQYYPASGSSVAIYAYYPANDGVMSTWGENNEFTVANDQSNDPAYKKSDLMYSNNITNITKASDASARTMNFSHKLAKLNVTLVAGDGMGNEELNNATITLKDVICKGTFTPASGNFAAAANEAANKSDIIVATNAGNTQHSAVVVPQNMAGKTIEIQIGEKTVEYTFPAEGSTFATNTQNNIELTLKNTGIEVKSSISAWGSGVELNNDEQELKY